MLAANLRFAALAALLGAVWLVSGELIVGPARDSAASGGQLVWLTSALLGLTAGAAALLVTLQAPLLLWNLPRRVMKAARAHAPVRFATGGSLLGGALALQWLNATAYVRLYLSLHLMLSATALLAAQLGCALLMPRIDRRLRPSVGLGLGAGLLLCAGIAVPVVTARPTLRFLAVEHTTLLAHELILLDKVTGVLAAPAITTGQADEQLLETMRPRAVTAPTGSARGANVLLITVDSLRADALTDDLALPAMQQLIAEGTRFERAYAPGCWTVHSMWSTFTSRYTSELQFAFLSVSPDFRFTAHALDSELVTNPLHRKKVVPVPHDYQRPTLTAALRQAGYETATSVAYLFYMREAGITRDFEHFDDTVYRNYNVKPEGVTSKPLTDQALFFLQRRDRSKPFFFWVHYMDPHSPYIVHDDQAIGGGELARYRGELRHVDQQLGRLLSAMRADGTLDNTIVILHADHGEEFGDHGGRFHATTVYDETVHVPLVVRMPASFSGQRGTTVATPVSNLDILPTVLDLLGVSADGPFRGRSLAPLLHGEPAPRRPVIAECFRFGRQKRAIVDWPHKLITDRSVGTYELYDLQRDPAERLNLVDREPEVFHRLLSLLHSL